MAKLPFGFTLLELIFVLVMVSAIATVSFPYGQQILVKQQVNSQLNRLVLLLNKARQYATRHQVNVIVCPVSQGIGITESSCNEHWRGSVLLFVDRDGNRNVSAVDSIIDQLEDIEVPILVNRRYFQFAALSRAATTSGTIKLCPGRHFSQYEKAIVISNVGRVRVEHQASRCPQ